MLGALPGVIGTMQAMEALKLLSGYGESLSGRMLHYDATVTKFREIKVRSNPDCALCGTNPTIVEPVQYEEACAAGSVMKEINVGELQKILADGFEGVLLDVREPDEFAWAHIEGSRLIPLQSLPAELGALPAEAEYLVYCKMGGRSAHATALMTEAGFTNVTNVAGGILAWLEAQGDVVQG